MTKIDGDAFAECSGLVDIKMHEGINTIGSRAFYKCDRLLILLYQIAWKKIEFEAFRGCDKLENIKLSENLTIVGYGVFGDCKSISKIEIPKSLKKFDGTWGRGTNLSYGAFGGCSNLKTVNFKQEVP